MPIEVRCGQCQGLLLIDTPDVVVACPLCEAHLSVPASDFSAAQLAVSEPQSETEVTPAAEVTAAAVETSVPEVASAVQTVSDQTVAVTAETTRTTPVESSSEHAITHAVTQTAGSPGMPTLEHSLPELAAAAGCPWFLGTDVSGAGASSGHAVGMGGLSDPHQAFNFSEPMKFSELLKYTEALSTPVAVPQTEPVAQPVAQMEAAFHTETVLPAPAEAPAATDLPPPEVPPSRQAGSSFHVTEDDSDLKFGLNCTDEGATELVPGSSPKLFASDTAIVEAASLAAIIIGEQPAPASADVSPVIVNGTAPSETQPPLQTDPVAPVALQSSAWSAGFPAAALPAGIGNPAAGTWSFGEQHTTDSLGQTAAVGVASLASTDWSGAASSSVTSPEQAPTAAVQTPPTQAVQMVPRQWFTATASYASLVTLILVYLLVTRWTARPHQLESLPDLIPKLTPRTGQPALEVAPPSANVAPGHRLKIGETGRFGSLQVTPVKVTCGPITFEHAFERDVPPRHPSLPVLKLWLAFHNVSTNQTFPPLGEELLFRRKYDHRFTYTLTNNFVAREQDRLKNGPTVCLYDLPVSSEFRIVGLDAAQEVLPGQTIQMFLPSDEEGADLLTAAGSEAGAEQNPADSAATAMTNPAVGTQDPMGSGGAEQLVWRVQFRKGYHPESLRGVTTLVDVVFSPSDVQQEAEVSTEQATNDVSEWRQAKPDPATLQST